MRRLHAWRGRALVAMLALLLLWAYLLRPELQFDSLEHHLYDSLVTFAPPVADEPRIVIVDIDEKSLARHGAWPWPRATVAQLVNELTDRHRVALVGLDIVFPLSRPGDAELRAALAHPQVVASQTLDFSPRSENRVGTLSGQVRVLGKDIAPRAFGFIANDRGLVPPHAGVGHISPLIDEDGRVRRLYPLACVADNCMLTLSLRMLAQLSADTDGAPRAITPEAEYLDRGTRLRVATGRAEPLELPLDRERALVVPYRVAAGGFPVVSAADAMDPARTIAALDNALVLVGSSALGIGDRVATPVDKLTPGVEVHAQLMAALLDQHLIRPLGADSAPFLLLLAAVLLSWLLWPRHRHAALLWPAVLLAVLTAVLSWLLLARNLWLPLSPLPLLVLAIAGLDLLRQNVSLSARLQGVGHRFSSFLPTMLVGRLLEEQRVGPETELRTMTVLIADIRGFTRASEGKQPEQVAEFAQKCFEVLSAEVARHGGIIEKYTGDGLVALWGVPAGGERTGRGVPLLVKPAATEGSAPAAEALDAARAVSAALAMQRGIHHLAGWFAERGYGPLKLSIGLNTGPLSVGVYGSRDHFAWSAQGQAFNVASRIERLTRELDDDLLMGLATAHLLAADQVRGVGQYVVEALSQPLDVYTVNNK